MNTLLKTLLHYAPIFSIGTIIVTLLSHFLNKRINPNDFEKKKLDLYEDMYFNGIVNGIGEEHKKEHKEIFFNNLILKLNENPKESRYLSDETKKALRYWKSGKIGINKLTYRVEKEYTQLQYRFQYKNRIFNPFNKYFLILFIFCFSFSILFSLIYFIFTDFSLIKEIFSEYNPLAIALLGSFGICYLSGIFLWEDRYLILNQTNKKLTNQININKITNSKFNRLFSLHFPKTGINHKKNKDIPKSKKAK